MGKPIITHPPVITIFICGINHSQSWVVYGMVLPTPYDSHEVPSAQMLGTEADPQRPKPDTWREYNLNKENIGI